MEKLKKYLEIEFVRYAISGILGIVAWYVVLFIFTEWFGVDYLVSSSIAYVVHYAVAFYLQKYWTFRNKEKNKTHQQVILYFGMALGYFFLNSYMMQELVSKYEVPYGLAQTIVVIVVCTLNFFTTRSILRVKK